MSVKYYQNGWKVRSHIQGTYTSPNIILQFEDTAYLPGIFIKNFLLTR